MSTENQSKTATATAETKAKPAPAADAASETSPQTELASCASPTEESREERALSVIKKYMLGNAAVSLVPVPLLDLVASIGVQLAMVRAVANIYDVPFKQDAVKEIVTTLITGIGTRTTALGFAYSFMKLVPGVGTALGAITLPVLTGAITYAVGKVFVLHFEAGGNVLNLDAKKMREYFQQQFNEGLEKAKTMAKEQAGATK